MKLVTRFVILALVTTGLSAAAEKLPFERYQSIIDRHPFGVPPPGFDPDRLPEDVQSSRAAEKSAKEVTQEQAKLQSSIQFSVITVTPEGDTAVGFTDNSDPKAPRHYYLKVGEERDGWVVKEADATKAWMKIAKDELEVELEIGGNSAGGAKGGTLRPPPASLLGNRSFPLRGGNANPSAPRPAFAAGGVAAVSPMSLRERRRLRQEEAQAAQAKAAAEAAERKAREDEEKAARDAEREAERAEHRAQLLAIQEELKRAREGKEKQRAAEAKAEEEGASGE